MVDRHYMVMFKRALLLNAWIARHKKVFWACKLIAYVKIYSKWVIHVEVEH